MPTKTYKVRGKKKAYKPKRRNVGKMKLYKNLNSPHPVYHWKRRFNGIGTGALTGTSSGAMPPTVLVSAGTTAQLGMEFMFSYVNNVAEFTSLFDSYRLNRIVIEMRIRGNPNTATTFNDGNYPEIFYCRDTDDSINISTSVMRDYGNFKRKILKPNQVVRISVRPNVLQPIYRAITNNYGPKWKCWIDATNADTPHFGLKLNISSGSTTVSPLIEFDYMYYFSTRTVR